MSNRIEVISKIPDTRAEVKKKKFNSMSLSGRLDEVRLVDVFTVDLSVGERVFSRISQLFFNHVFQKLLSYKDINKFDYAIEIGFHPGVTDNIGTTARESIEDLLKLEMPDQTAYFSQLLFLTGKLTQNDIQKIADSVANPLIQKIRIKSYQEFQKDNGMGIVILKVNLHEQLKADLVDINDKAKGYIKYYCDQGIAGGTVSGNIGSLGVSCDLGVGVQCKQP